MSVVRGVLALALAGLCATAGAQAAAPGCHERAAALDERRAALRDAHDEAARETASLQSRTLALQAERAKLEDTESYKVSDYNERAKQHRERVDAHNAQLVAINADIDRLNQDLELARRECGIAKSGPASPYNAFAFGLVSTEESEALDRSALAGRVGRKTWGDPDRARREGFRALANPVELQSSPALPASLTAAYLAAVSSSLATQKRLAVVSAGNDAVLLVGMSVVTAPDRPPMMEAVLVMLPAKSAGEGGLQAALAAKTWYAVVRRTLAVAPASAEAIAADPKALKAWQSLLDAAFERFLQGPS